MFDGFEEDDDVSSLIDNLPTSIRDGLIKIELHHEGNKTIVKNFGKIVTQLSRDRRHITKFMKNKLGSKIEIDGTQLIISKIIDKIAVNNTFSEYIDKYVICQNCGKPDTLFTKLKKKKLEIRCLSCGSIYEI